jgi:hypothetical protein
VLFAPLPLAGSVQVAPLLRVTGPLKTIARDVTLVDPKLIAPVIEAAPFTVKDRKMFIVPPLLMVSEEAV